LVAHDDNAPDQPAAMIGRTSWQKLLCSGQNCPPIDNDRAEAISGRWFQHTIVMPATGCSYCAPRRIDYSVRIFQ
ncbi:MAG: hypothetical protein AAF761_04965, partial [Pseudomonadota bacterium]